MGAEAVQSQSNIYVDSTVLCGLQICLCAAGVTVVGAVCMSCSCVKSDGPCIDCFPSHKGHCCTKAPAFVFANVYSDNVADFLDTLAGSTAIKASAILDNVVPETDTASLEATCTLPLFKPATRLTSS